MITTEINETVIKTEKLKCLKHSLLFVENVVILCISLKNVSVEGHSQKLIMFLECKESISCSSRGTN